MPQTLNSLLARLRFRHLQLMVEIDRTGSLNRASEVLNLTQPALSKSLKDMEEALGFTLFSRTTRGLEKTVQGAIVIEGARLILEELRHLHHEASISRHGDLAAVLRLGAPVYLTASLVPRIIARLIKQDPPVIVQLSENQVPQLFDQLVHGKLDALVTVYNPDVLANMRNQDLCFEKIAEEQYEVIAPLGHPMTEHKRVSWEQLLSFPWVLTRKPSLARVFIEDCFLQFGLMPPSPVCVTENPLTNVHLVAQGAGLSMVPGSLLEVTDIRSRIGRVRLPPLPATHLGLVYRQTATLHPRIRHLRQAVFETSSPLPT